MRSSYRFNARKARELTTTMRVCKDRALGVLTSSFAIAAIIVLGGLFGLQNSLSSGQASIEAGLHVEVTNDTYGYLNASLIDGAVAAIYSNASSNCSETTWPSQALISTVILTGWNDVNATLSFGSLIASWGTNNITFTINFLAASGITNATYGVSWTEGGYTYEDFWMAYFSSGSSPLLESVSAESLFDAPSLYAGNTAVQAGYVGGEVYTGGSIVNAVQQIATVTDFSSPPSGSGTITCPGTGCPISIDPIAAPWVGICDSSQCTHRIIQEGYQIDTQNPYSALSFYWPYTFWYEEVCAGCAGGGPSKPFLLSAAPSIVSAMSASPGNLLIEDISGAQCNTWFSTSYADFMFDVSTGWGGLAISQTPCAYAPRYVESIVEAPETNAPGGLQYEQIPSWEGASSGGIGYIFTQSGGNWPANYCNGANGGTCNLYTLDQESAGFTNADSSWSNGWSNSYWLSSDYNYGFVG